MIWDGQTIAVSEKQGENSARVIFLRAQLMDPAGMPSNPEVGKKDSENSSKPGTEIIEAPSIEELKKEKEKPRDLTPEEIERVNRADQAALRANQMHADGELEGAAKTYESALSLLPEHTLVDDRIRVYRQQRDRVLE